MIESSPASSASTSRQGTVVQFGAGNIGRGFMGQIYTEAGYEVVFVDVVPEIVTALNERRSYPLRLAGPERFETLEIRPVRAVDGREVDAVARELEACSFACTAVGVPALPHLAPALASGILARPQPLTVVLCENQFRCSDLLRELLSSHLPDEALAATRLVESVVSRMVPVVPEIERQRDPLLAIAEDYPVLPVDRRAFEGEIPAVSAFQPVENFPAYVERKMYVHNMGHAVAAYLGYLRGCRYIHEVMGEPDLAFVVEEAMEEVCEALARKHGFDRRQLAAHRQDLVRRFANEALRDTVFRVGRDPARKLRAQDRLVGAALTCLDWGVQPDRVTLGIAAALRFDAPEDPGAGAVQRVIREEGIGQALLQFTGQRPDSELGRLVSKAWEALG